MNAPVPLSAAVRFALIMDGLGKAVAARIGHYPITGPMIVYIWKRLSRINQKFQALAAMILAGKLPAERAYWPRGGTTVTSDPGAPAAARPFPVWRLLPMKRSGWLCWVAPNHPGCASAAVYGEALRNLLGDPEMAALLAATPRMGKLLRPLCWALGVAVATPRRRRKRTLPETAAEAGDAATGGIVSRAPRAKRRTRASDLPPGSRRMDDERWSRFLPLA